MYYSLYLCVRYIKYLIDIGYYKYHYNYSLDFAIVPNQKVNEKFFGFDFKIIFNNFKYIINIINCIILLFYHFIGHKETEENMKQNFSSTTHLMKNKKFVSPLNLMEITQNLN
ncbi:MAG: Unknown protein [uncultured Sulfurovum sp.]|uniref:Uncharacterized protein n=1 Tax=uncultured Sulfurovum sp. TaxID=269237 RepID=A0A6S6UAR1_9BACT|nr:MAG: Unknown protein [uncultured Sulfurovum sp.]